MRTTIPIQACAIGLVLVLVGGEIAEAEMPPPEPDEAYLVDEDINIVTGLYMREYSLRKDGIVDYKTARQILISEYNEHWNSVVETKEWPLFYWHDVNRDGHWSMYVDRKVNGCTCDIVPYEVKTEDTIAQNDLY
ncbi:MAG TPA: hypothetical protein PKM72_14160 [Nitrospirales bacterium]|nr:hypothetical protein [Nitrospirales bacterium]